MEGMVVPTPEGVWGKIVWVDTTSPSSSGCAFFPLSRLTPVRERKGAVRTRDGSHYSDHRLSLRM